MNHNRYVVEIDSVRAFAVLSVVSFHAIGGVFAGGFIGVDIFFTVSGYVIARRYLHGLRSGEFHLRDFFLARIRRLAPALFLVLLLSTLVATLFALPDNLLSFAYSLAAQPFYFQNFVFWHEGDYFERALSRPLLHTWSLAVEEQFYFLFAVCLLVFRRRWTLLIVAIVLGSFLSIVLGSVIEPRSPKTVFFMLPTRIWQFSTGILFYLVSHWILNKGVGHKLAPLSFLGFAILLVTVFGFDKNSTFPGQQAMLACIGTILILLAVEVSPSNLINGWLRVGPITYVGRVSYGLYLWHWPPLAFWYIEFGSDPGLGVSLLLMLFAFVAASLSFHLVEQPIRERKFLNSDSKILRAFILGSLLVFSYAAIVISSNGLIQRYPSELRPYLDAPNQRGQFRCGKLFAAIKPNAQICPINEASKHSEKGILLLGDSHADMLKETLATIASETGQRLFLTSRNCELGQYGNSEFCNEYVLTQVVEEAKESGISQVIAVSFWDEKSLSLNGLVSDISLVVESGLNVAVLGPLPFDLELDPRKRAIDAINGLPLNRKGMEKSKYLMQSKGIVSTLRQALSEFSTNNVHFLDPGEALCKRHYCSYEKDGKPYYFDSNHLTFLGAKELIPVFSPIFESSLEE